MQIALFGGRFDPVHNGHVAIAHEVLRAVPSVDEVWMVPDYKHHWNPTVASFEDRMHMLTLVTQDTKTNAQGKIKVSDIGKVVAQKRDGMTVTIDVIRALQSAEYAIDYNKQLPFRNVISSLAERSPREKISYFRPAQVRNDKPNTYLFIAGSDQLPRLGEWHEYEELHMRLPFLIFPRKGYQTSGDLPEGCMWLSDTQFEPMDDSATRVRERLKKGEPISDLVPKKVEEYIREKGLYR